MDDIKRNNLKNILFLDIETVSEYKDFELLPERLKPHWERKAELLKQRGDFQDETAPELYSKRGAIYSEFGKIVCISVG